MPFDGWTYVPILDRKRLIKQMDRVFMLMKDGQWRTLEQICAVVNAPPQSVSARLRDLRKAKFWLIYGQCDVLDNRKGNKESGLWEYRVIWYGPPGSTVPSETTVPLPQLSLM